MNEATSVPEARGQASGLQETDEQYGPAQADPLLEALVHGYGGDPFALLGPHPTGRGTVRVRAMAQGAQAVTLLGADGKVVLSR